MNNAVIDRAEAEKILFRLFKGGPLRHMPRSRRDTELLVALAASYLDPRAVYSEKAVNDLIREWMTGFTDSVTMDHVTIRRYLVDYHILLREENGENYRTNQMVLNAFITPDARAIRPQEILRQVEAQREERRKAALADR